MGGIADVVEMCEWGLEVHFYYLTSAVTQEEK